MFSQQNVLSNSLLKFEEGLYKVYHDTSLFGDGTRTSPLRVLSLNTTGLLQLGGATSSYPAFKRDNANVKIILADDSGYTAVQSLYQRFGSGSPEGVVTAPVGAVYHRTNGGAGTSFYVKESGSGNTGWVAK